jgi:hypothetical protein
VVAGIGTDAFVNRKLRRPEGWSDWVKVGTAKAKGTLALTSSTNGGGSMYYIDASGETVEVTTSDFGDTWASRTVGPLALELVALRR